MTPADDFSSQHRVKPDHAAVQALADAVLRGMRAGDLVASRAAARALSVLVDALTEAASEWEQHVGQDPVVTGGRRGTRK